MTSALCALGGLFYEVLDDLVAHVCLEQRKAHLAHSIVDVELRQPALASELLEGGV